jgi:hypothetical protein
MQHNASSNYATEYPHTKIKLYFIPLLTAVERFNEDGTEVLLANPSNCRSTYQKLIHFHLCFYRKFWLGGWYYCFIFATCHFHISPPISSVLARVFCGFPSLWRQRLGQYCLPRIRPLLHPSGPFRFIIH